MDISSTVDSHQRRLVHGLNCGSRIRGNTFRIDHLVDGEIISLEFRDMDKAVEIFNQIAED